jgi:hypothetical protein
MIFNKSYSFGFAADILRTWMHFSKQFALVEDGLMLETRMRVEE